MRDDCARMSSPRATDRPSNQRRAGGAPRPRDPGADSPGVLGSLPSTRPQRPSARRAAARRAAATEPATKGTKTPSRPAASARPRRSARTPPEPSEPPVPPQGFETEEPIEPGRPVQPPSGPELVASVADLFGELAQAGLSTGERLVRDALRRLSGD